MRGDRRVLWMLLATAGTLGLGALVKWPCLHHPWDGFQYAAVCYSDITGLYHVRGTAEGVVPYVEGFSEYPVLVGLWTWIAGMLGEDMAGYFWVNVWVLGACALGVTLVLSRMVEGRRIWLWALAPSLALSAFLNFDLMAVLLATLGLWAYRRERFGLAALFLGLGAAAKLYPAYFVPVLAAELLRRFGMRRALGFTALSAGAWAVPQLPVFLLSPSGWWATYSFHRDRTYEWETIWAILNHLVNDRGVSLLEPLTEPLVMKTVSAALFLLVLAGATYLTWRGRMTPIEGCLVALVGFFAASPVFNMQYVLWVLPLLVLLPVDVRVVTAILLADVGVHLTKFHLFLHFGSAEYAGHFAVFALLVAVRLVLLVVVAVSVVRAAWDRPVLDGGGPTPSAPAGGDPMARASTEAPATDEPA